MGWIDRILGAGDKAPQPGPIKLLPLLGSRSATELAQIARLSPEMDSIVQTCESPSELVHRLQAAHYSHDAVKVLAHGMEPRNAIGWAVKSAQRGGISRDPADDAAARAAEAWVTSPGDKTLAAAAAAAAKTDFQGPGAWAAQAVAFTRPQLKVLEVPHRPPIKLPVAEGLCAQAVAGAVMISAARTREGSVPAAPLPSRPAKTLPPVVVVPAGKPQPAPPTSAAERKAAAPSIDPFIELGKDVAGGKVSWS